VQLPGDGDARELLEQIKRETEIRRPEKGKRETGERKPKTGRIHLNARVQDDMELKQVAEPEGKYGKKK
jgi:hypothetical protein